MKRCKIAGVRAGWGIITAATLISASLAVAANLNENGAQLIMNDSTAWSGAVTSNANGMSVVLRGTVDQGGWHDNGFAAQLLLNPMMLVFTSKHSADQNGDWKISLTELLRVIQFFNLRGYYCAEAPSLTEDGFQPGTGANHGCAPHASDYSPADWKISLTELLRLIQFFNLRGYHVCPDQSTEDGFCPGVE